MAGTLVQIEFQPSAARARLPEWLRKPATHFAAVGPMQRELRSLGLHTVCESARCPNLHECFHRGTATFLILGDRCTRDCGFCAVPRDTPARGGQALDAAEPAKVASMAARLGLGYVVLTSVTRDDLEDGGSDHFARTIREVRRALPRARVEALTPDFRGRPEAVARVLEAGPHVFNHNVETVPRLYARVRPQAGYRRSLDVLARAGRHSPSTLVKSGLMVGLGEEPSEVEEVLGDLRAAGVGIVTIGQYLQPARRSLPVARFVEPAEFEGWRRFGLALGFRAVFSGPLVRSSYMAEAVSGEAWRAEA